MKLLFSDFKKGLVKLQITAPEDLWHLSQIIEAGDHLGGKTLRKITLGSSETKTIHVQKAVFLEIAVETVDFSPNAAALRVSGKITISPDDVPHGSYHTFVLEQNTEFSLHKEEWLTYHKSQFEEASKASSKPLLICILDRDEALIALSRQWGIEILTRLRGDPEKKEKRAQTRSNLSTELIKLLESQNARYEPSYLVIASPAFYKEELAKLIKDPALKKKLVLATCSSVSENAFQEVLKRPETKHACHQVRIAEEEAAVDKLLIALAKSQNATYGLNHVKKAVDSGAVAELLVTNEFVRLHQQSGTFADINNIMKQVDRSNGKIHIVSTEHEAGKKLQGLGGIAALLRYNLDW